MIIQAIPGEYRCNVYTDYGTRLVPFVTVVAPNAPAFTGSIAQLRKNGPSFRCLPGEHVAVGAYGVRYRLMPSPQIGPAGELP